MTNSERQNFIWIWRSRCLVFGGKERKIAERMLLYGENDKELARYEGVSRQYCNKIRGKIYKKDVDLKN